MTLALLVVARNQDSLEADFFAVQLRDGVLGVVGIGHPDAGGHVAIRLVVDRHVEDGDMLAKEAADGLFHFTLVDALVKIGDLELHWLHLPRLGHLKLNKKPLISVTFR